jgi:probable F420-dependent oxidoreductase
MKHSVVFPLVSHPYNPELVRPEAVVRFAQAAEAAGFCGICFTDHPAPSDKWLNSGGHDALDPFTALAFIAGVTQQLRLIPHIAVLAYRNPFLVAKMTATLDLLSGGRFVLSVASGYLRSEYRALGVDFEQRNALFDEALSVMRGVWTTDRFAFEGTGYVATEVSANPKPGYVPIWIGGNSAVTRRRVAGFGDGWNPFVASPVLAKTARTTPLESLDDLAPLIEDLHRLTDAAGRDPETIDVQFSTRLPGPGDTSFSAGRHLDALSDMAAIGITWNNVGVPGTSLQAALEALEQYGAEVIAQSA